jgi:hypothetical protein
MRIIVELEVVSVQTAQTGTPPAPPPPGQQSRFTYAGPVPEAVRLRASQLGGGGPGAGAAGRPTGKHA